MLQARSTYRSGFMPGRECQICGGQPACLTCAHCHAIFYCCEEHRKFHLASGHAGKECQRMRLQRERAPMLRDFPFTWTKALIPEVDSCVASLCSVLKALGLHDHPIWCNDCCRHLNAACYAKHFAIMDTDALPPSCLSFLQAQSSGADETRTAGDDPSMWHSSSNLQSWSDYYLWRSLPLDHPAAIVMSTVLTLFRALQWCLHHLQCDSPPEELIIDVLGARQEVGQRSLLFELTHLMPASFLNIRFVGPHVPPQLARHHLSNTRSGVAFSFHAGYYHEVIPELGRPPDMIFAQNAGFPAYSSWTATLQKLPRDAPLIATDFCEEAANRAAQMAQCVSGRALAMPVSVNPFRQPVSCHNADNALPSYSNGFMFALA